MSPLLPDPANDSSSSEQRLADQQRSDQAASYARESAREYERGRKEAELAAHTAEQDRHFAVINGSIERTAKGLAEVNKQLLELKVTFDQSVAITAALSAKTLSSRATLALAAGIIIPMLGLIIAVLTTLH